MRRTAVIALLVGAVVLTAFLPDLRNALLSYDDRGYILDDPHVRSLSLDTLGWAFTSFHCNYWAPLTWLSYAFDFTAWGPAPWGFHLTNDLLHAANAALFFVAARLLLGARAARQPGVPAASPFVQLAAPALAALAWGLHPLRVESVAWAAERKDVLSAFFGLAALVAWLTHVGRAGGPDAPPAWRSACWWRALALYACSMGSKAMMLTLPFALLGLDAWPLGRIRAVPLRRLLLEKVPLLAVAVGGSIVTASAMAVTSKSFAEIAPADRLLTAFKALVAYPGLTLLPVGVSPVYFHPVSVPLDAAAVLSVAAVLGVTAACWLLRDRWPAAGVAWALYVLTVFPVLGLTQNGNQELAGRFSYVPTLPLFLAAAVGLALGWERLAARPAARWAATLAVAALLVAEVRGTAAEIAHWRDDVTFWTRVIDTQPRRFGLPYSQRALFLTERGEYARALADVDVGLEIASAKRFERLHEVVAQRARLLAQMGRREEALAGLDRAAGLAPPELAPMYRAERDELARTSGSSAR
jgi:hypothetical protein